jgi:hypothetical protein
MMAMIKTSAHKRVARYAAMLTLAAVALPAPAQAFEAMGKKTIFLHPREGAKLAVGEVMFSAAPASPAGQVGPVGPGRKFQVSMRHDVLKDHFLSMREFKCAESVPGGKGEILCHVPYPYAHSATVQAGTPGEWAWLEHSLMFMFKLPSEFGAKLWNGIYFQLKADGSTLVGTPQAIDLNQIASPPTKADTPPFTKAKRDDFNVNTRWFNKLTIE